MPKPFSTQLPEGMSTMSGPKMAYLGHFRQPRYVRAGHNSNGHFIQKAIKHPGALHRELGVPQGKKIPDSKIRAAEHSKNKTLARRARFAEELKGFHH